MTAPGLREVLLGYVALAAVVGRRDGPVLCPWRRLTGRRCPVCGLTRSIASSVRGDLRRSWREHPAGAAVVVVTLTTVLTPSRAPRASPGAGGAPPSARRR